MEIRIREYDEDDETMIVVRGANQGNVVSIVDPETASNEKPLAVTEFSLCDYYLVIGNRHKFRLYPFVKKKGVPTAQVANCMLTYDKSNKELVFTSDLHYNTKLINQNPKEKTLLLFLCSLVGCGLKELLDITLLQQSCGITPQNQLCFFQLLELTDAYYHHKRETL